MLLWTRHTYTNKLKDGAGHDCGLYFESEERAKEAAMGAESSYHSIAVHSEFRVYRCDDCLDNGIANSGSPHAMTGKDLCSDHRKAAEKALH